MSQTVSSSLAEEYEGFPQGEFLWTADCAQILRQLQVDARSGLPADQVRKRQTEFGSNQIAETASKSPWMILWSQLKSLIVVLLLAAAVASLFFSQWMEACAIAAVIVLNALIGFAMELRAVRSMEALRKLGSTGVIVRRDGQQREVDCEQLVPGDIVVLDAGDAITADLRIVQSSKLQSDESALTGESVPVSKSAEKLPADTPLAERTNMLFKGTLLTRGSGEAVVVSTGMQTQLGQIASLLDMASGDDRTPLERRLENLGQELVWLTLGITLLVALIGYLRGNELLLMIETGVALAVSAIPEGLPIVATLALARGMLRMARQNVLIRRLAAVETLGATSVICTDKTGTITENQMVVTRVVVPQGQVWLDDEHVIRWEPTDASSSQGLRAAVQQASEIGVLCNNASLLMGTASARQGTGDPMERALLVAADALQVERDVLRTRLPEIREVAFDSQVKMMATIHARESQYQVAVKGAPEMVLAASTQIWSLEGPVNLDEALRRDWSERNRELGSLGLRVLGLATRLTSDPDRHPYQDLVFVGLVAMEDPPRAEVAAAIASCRDAGIKVVMITGDQWVTAKKIAEDIGLLDDTGQKVLSGSDIDSATDSQLRQQLLDVRVFARVSPEQKLQLIQLHQESGAIVAMTGDGVNDAPALEKADIGVAMGLRGTQVARDAADMVLQDDSLASIVTAIHQGRVIYGNIRKFVVYLLSCNCSEVLVVGMAFLLDWPLPLLPLQILFLNLITDVFPALALGAGNGDPTVMQGCPRQRDGVLLGRNDWVRIAAYATIITASVLAASWVARHVWQLPAVQAVTVSFLTMAWAQLWHVFNMREANSSIWWNEITRNRYVWLALLLCLMMIAVAIYVPWIGAALQLADPGWQGGMTALLFSLPPLILRMLWR